MPDSWQDIVMTVGIWIFNYGILQMALNRTLLPRTTMTINLSVTTLFLAVFVSLSLWYTVASIGAQLVLWGFVAVRGRQSVVAAELASDAIDAASSVTPADTDPLAGESTMPPADGVRNLDPVTAVARVAVED